MFNWLFGGSEAAVKTIDTIGASVKGIGNFIDEQQLTDQEKAELTKDSIAAHLDFIKVAYSENTVRSVTRRVMAWVIVFNVLVLANISVYFAITGNPEAIKAIVDVANKFWLGETFITIIGFYYGIQFFRK